MVSPTTGRPGGYRIPSTGLLIAGLWIEYIECDVIIVGVIMPGYLEIFP
jgi:hypothetical protein